MSILVRGCVGCPFLRQGVDDSPEPAFVDSAGRGAADYCSAESFLREPPRPAFRMIEGGAELTSLPDWCPLRSMAITVRRAG